MDISVNILRDQTLQPKMNDVPEIKQKGYLKLLKNKCLILC